MLRKAFCILILFSIMIFVFYQISAPTKSFSEIYKQEDIYTARLDSIHSQKTKRITIKGVEWTYFSAGKGDTTIVFAHGMGGAYDIWWNQLQAFQKEYNVISYTLPKEIHNLRDASHGILKIIEAENIDSFIMIGTSMGGYITQYIVNNYPEKIQKAVFGNTFPPNDYIVKSNAKISKVLPYLPEIFVANFFKRKMRNDIEQTASGSNLLRAALFSIAFDKESFIGRYQVVIDSFKTHTNQLKVQNIPKLIIESDNDPAIPKHLREKLKDLYPNAGVYTFHEKGHFPYVNADSIYTEVLSNFIK